MVGSTVRQDQPPEAPELLRRIWSVLQTDVPAELSRTHTRGAYGQGKAADGIALVKLIAQCHPTVDTFGAGLAMSLLQAGSKAQAEGISYHPFRDGFRSREFSQYFLGHNCSFSYTSGN